MKVLITDVFIAIADFSKEESAEIKSKFTFKDMSKAMTSNGFNKRKVKTICFAKTRKGFIVLKSGFLKELFELFKEISVTSLTVEDKRTKLINNKYTDSQLRKFFNPDFNYVYHQIRALKALLKTNVGIIKAPTGSGKGDIISSYIKISKMSILVLVNKVMLGEQLYERFRADGIEDIGLCNGKGVKNPFAKTMVSTIGSVKKINLEKFECVIGDEVHNFSSKQFQSFFEETSFPYRFGFSATPNKGDKFNYALIRQFLGDVIEEINSSELIENKIIAEPFIYFVKNNVKNHLDFQTSYKKEIINNKERNDSIVKIINNFDLPSLVLIQDVVNGQGEYIKEELEKNNKKVYFISGKTPDRHEYIEKLEKDEIDVLIATNILNEGISIKNIKLLINASGLKSNSMTAQKLGRGLRVKEGKTSVAVIDFLDSGNKFLESHALKRIAIFQKHGFCKITKLRLEEILEYDKKKIIGSN